MRDLELLDAEVLGFDGMDLVRALPGVLQQTGQIVKVEEDKKKAAQRPAAAPVAPVAPVAPKPAPASSGHVKTALRLGAAAAFGAVVVLLLKR